MTVRSLFEQCGELWAPVDYVAANKFEPIQKQAVSNQAFSTKLITIMPKKAWSATYDTVFSIIVS